MPLRSPFPSGGALAVVLLLAGCAPAPIAPTVLAVPPPTPAQSKSAEGGEIPLTAGAWRYQPGADISYARYGRAGAAPDIVLRCDRVNRQIALLRNGAAAEIVVTTSAGAERFAAGRIDVNGVAMSGAIFNAADGFLDRFAFSRGRVSIASAGQPTLIAPAWAEPARAIEDCRK